MVNDDSIIVRSVLSTPRRSTAAGNDVDLYDTTTRKMCDADRSPRREATSSKVAPVNPVHCRIVPREVCQEDPHADHTIEVEPRSLQHALEVLHYLAHLRLDAIGQRSRVVVWIGRQLAGDERPPVYFD